MNPSRRTIIETAIAMAILLGMAYFLFWIATHDQPFAELPDKFNPDSIQLDGK